VREEIEHLNIEICRVITYMEDEAVYLKAAEDEAAKNDVHLAHQIAVYRMERGRAFSTHKSCFRKLLNNLRFTGTIVLGTSTCLPSPNLNSQTFEGQRAENGGDIDVDQEKEDDEGLGSEDDIDVISYKILTVSLDESKQSDDWMDL
jgi:hypothetical protein